MYKKITRNISEDIIEEHFEHPGAPQVKKLLEKKYEVTIAPVNVEIFKTNVKDYFTDYNKKMINILAGVTLSNDDLEKAEEEMFADIDRIGLLTKPYYGIEFGEKLNQSVRGYALAMAQIVNFMKVGLDIKDITNYRIINILSNDLSKMLNSYNNIWLQDTLKRYWIQICNHWIESAKARLRKDSKAEQDAITNATNVINAFANSLAAGIIAQFPNQFTTGEPIISDK
jgi:pectate lyase